MALPTFQSIAFQLDTSAASIDVDVSSLGLAEGDALIVLSAEDSNPDGHTVSGNNSGAYALLHESSSSSPSSTVAWKVQGATPDTSVNVNLINIRATGTTGLIVKIPNVNVGNPIDAALVNLAGASGMPNPPALTTVTANAVRIITGHLDDDVTPVTAPSGFEQVIYHGVTNATGGNTTVMIAFREEATPGGLDPSAFISGDGSGDDEWWATHFAVNLASGGGGEAGVSGDLAATESGDDTATVSVATSVSSALSAMEAGADAAALEGAIVVSGSIGPTEVGEDTAAASGGVAIAGFLAAGEAGQDSASASGIVGDVPAGSVIGTLSATEAGQDSVAISGVIVATGEVSAHEGGKDLAEAVASVAVSGAVSVQEAGEDQAQGAGLGTADATLPPLRRIVTVSAQTRVVTVSAQSRIVSAA